MSVRLFSWWFHVWWFAGKGAKQGYLDAKTDYVRGFYFSVRNVTVGIVRVL